MTRDAIRQWPVLLCSCRWPPAVTVVHDADGADGGAVLPRRHMAGHDDDSARSDGRVPGSPVSGPVTWTFEVVPQTNLQSFRTTIRSENGWLPITLTSSTSMIPGNTPPAQISTQGEYESPRGCRGTFGSFATAEARTIQGSITGVDCPVPFTGSVTLTKE